MSSFQRLLSTTGCYSADATRYMGMQSEGYIKSDVRQHVGRADVHYVERRIYVDFKRTAERKVAVTFDQVWLRALVSLRARVGVWMADGTAHSLAAGEAADHGVALPVFLACDLTPAGEFRHVLSTWVFERLLSTARRGWADGAPCTTNRIE